MEVCTLTILPEKLSREEIEMEELSEKEKEILVQLVKSNCSASERNFPFTIEKLSEGLIEEEEVEFLLAKLKENHYIEIEYSSIMLTEKGKSGITNFVFHNWREAKTRWRRIFTKSAWVANIAKSEIELVRMLLEDGSLEVNEELLDKLEIEESEFRILSESKITRIESYDGRKYLTRGPRFIKKCAEIVHNAENQSYHSVAKEWMEGITKFYISIKDQERREKHKDEFQRELYKIKSIEICPIGLPVKCFESFLHDEDSLFETERHLSSRRFDCKISIKPSFYDGCNENLLFVEIAQPEDLEDEGILLKGEISEVRDLLLKIKEEMDKIKEENNDIEFRKKQSSFRFEVVYISQSEIKINILNYISTYRERIASISYDDVQTILNEIQ